MDIYNSEVNFEISGKIFYCPLLIQDNKTVMYVVPEVYDALDESYQSKLKYAKKPILYKERLFNSYIEIEEDVIKYIDDSELKSAICTNMYNKRKLSFVVNYIDGWFDILSTDWYIIKFITRLTMHVCCEDYGESHTHEPGITPYTYHCILESYDITDKAKALQAAIEKHISGDDMRLYKDLAYYPDIEETLGVFTKTNDGQKWNNLYSELSPYGVWRLDKELRNHIEDQGKSLYVVFECEYERHRVKTAPDVDYHPTGYGCIPDALEKIEFEDDYHNVVMTEWSQEIPLNSNDFLISSYNNIYLKVKKSIMERISRPIDVIKIEKQVIKEVEPTIKETVVIPAFYQTIVNNEVLELIKNRYNIAINIFNHASYIKDKVLYIQIGNITFNEVGRNVNHVIFQIDGNIIKDKEGKVNIIDDDDNVIYTQKYKIV